MISAFGIDHGEEIAKYNPAQQEVADKTKRRSKMLWGAHALGAAGALAMKSPGGAAGAVLSAPVTVTANAVHGARKVRRLGEQPVTKSLLSGLGRGKLRPIGDRQLANATNLWRADMDKPWMPLPSGRQARRNIREAAQMERGFNSAMRNSGPTGPVKGASANSFTAGRQKASRLQERLSKRGPFGTVGGKLSKPLTNYGHKNIIAGTDRVNGVKNGNGHPRGWDAATIAEYERGTKQVRAGSRAMKVGLAMDNHASATGVGAVVVPTAAAGVVGAKVYGYKKYKKHKSAGDGGPVAKSYVNGKFVSALELSAKQRTKVAAGGQWHKARGVDPKEKKWLKHRTKEIVPAVKQAAKDEKKYGSSDAVGPGVAGTYRIGGPSSGKSYVLGVKGMKEQLRYAPKHLRPIARQVKIHEGLHAAPKRSAYRLHYQIMNSPEKMLREEGRADYFSGGHFTRHPEGGSGYANAANTRDQMIRRGPNKNYKFTPLGRKTVKQAEIDIPKVKNKKAYANTKAGIQMQLPHYKMKGKKGDRAIDAYRNLHDSLRAKGVRGGTIWDHNQ